MGPIQTNAGGRTNGPFLSIGVKLAGTIVVLIGVLAACVYTSLTRYERDNMMASKEAAASMVARLYVATEAAPLTFGDEQGVKDAVALLAANDDIVYAAAWSVTQPEKGLGERLGELRRGNVVDPPATMPLDMRIRRTNEAVIVEAPATNPSGKVVGVVQAAFSLAREYEALRSIERRTLGFSIAASLLLTAALLLLAQKVIVRPLARLAGAAQSLERGEQPELEMPANDEIGQLATAFVSMSRAIDQREKRIAERNRDMRRVLDNVEDGFLAVTPAGVMSDERSRIIEDWFGAPPPGASLFGYLEQIAGPAFAEWFGVHWEALIDGFLPMELTIDQLPKRFDRDGRVYSMSYRPILDGESLEAMLVVMRDDTQRVERERAEQRQREMMVVFNHLLTDPAGFEEFFTDATRLVDSIDPGATLDDATLQRQIHTLKGNAAIFGLESVSRSCHELESSMVERGSRPTRAETSALRALWDGLKNTYRKFGGRAQIVLKDDDLSDFLRAVRRGADARAIEAIVKSWCYERADARMSAIGEQVKQTARRLEKGEVQVRIAPTKLRLPRHRWAPFWSVFSHVVRNAVDHGMEGPDKRLALGKPASATVQMSFEDHQSEIVFSFGDDGAGIDWERVAEKAKERGLPAATRKDLENALYVDNLSTRHEVTETSGRGVGMAAVLGCVRALGGTIEVESKRGEGTKWLFRFPRSMLEGDDAAADVPPAGLEDVARARSQCAGGAY